MAEKNDQILDAIRDDMADGMTVTSIGAVGDAAWTTGEGTVIALLKAIHAQLVIIAANTEPA